MYLGKRLIGTTVTIPCVTYTTSTGAATNADSNPIYRIYKNGNSIPIITGTIPRIDSTNTTGFYLTAVLLSPLKGFARRREYVVYIETLVSSIKKTVIYYFEIE